MYRITLHPDIELAHILAYGRESVIKLQAKHGHNASYFDIKPNSFGRYELVVDAHLADVCVTVLDYYITACQVRAIAVDSVSPLTGEALDDPFDRAYSLIRDFRDELVVSVNTNRLAHYYVKPEKKE